MTDLNIEKSTEWSSHDVLRPRDLSEFGGQPRLVNELGVVLGSAKARAKLPDHLLFAGPPGLGKTTLANVVAHELGLPLLTTSGPAIERPGDLAAMISGIVGTSVLFIDEIHRLGRQTEELLYPVMEDGTLDLVTGDAPNTRILRLETAPLVIIGATTQLGLLASPLRDRFGYLGRLELYEDDALANIVQRSARMTDLVLTDEAALAVASRSRGTPRVANALLRRVHDVAIMENADTIDLDLVRKALEFFGIDDLGLDTLAIRILGALCTQFNGGPTGVATLAASVGEAAVTLEEVYEPFLMRKGLLIKTKQGRMATPLCYQHLDLAVPAKALQIGSQIPLEVPEPS
jgi:Holliday junction DNA helicase RuvB